MPSDQMASFTPEMGLLMSHYSLSLSLVPPTPFLGVLEYKEVGALKNQELGWMKLVGMRAV